MTTETTTPRRKGRKPISEGGKSSPREVRVSCAAIVDGQLVHERLVCKKCTNSSSDEEIYAEISEKFEAEHGVEPSMLEPDFKRTGTNSKAKARDTISIPIEELEFKSGKPGSAVYKDWNVVTRFIENRNDAVFIQYKTHTKEDKKTKPTNKVVYIHALSDFKSPECNA